MVRRRPVETYKCAVCGWVIARRGWTGTCPDCGRLLGSHTCTRCGHTWVPRMRTPAKVCPACKSPYWNKKRVIRRKEK